jgi:hypothetical protein
MLSDLICINALVCERILHETEHVISLIRIVDLFWISPIPDMPIEKQHARMELFISGKLSPEDDKEHEIEIRMSRPGGSIVSIGEPYKAIMETSIDGFPRGFNLSAQLNVIPKEMGIYYFEVWFDKEFAAKVPFAIKPRTSET